MAQIGSTINDIWLTINEIKDKENSRRARESEIPVQPTAATEVSKEPAVQMEVGGKEGNKKSSRQISSKYWCSGVFNYEPAQLAQIFEQEPRIDRVLGNWEICPKSGNNHLQTYFSFHDRQRPSEVFPQLAIKWIKCDGSLCKNILYVFKDKCNGKPDLNVGFEDHEWDIDYRIHEQELRPNQLLLKRLTYHEPNKAYKKFSREIIWVYDEMSEWGKSIWAAHMVDFCGGLMLGGKETDMLFGFYNYIKEKNECKILIINQTFSKDKVSYNGLESLKDGSFFNSKYESGQIRFPRPIIVVLSNNLPDMEMMGSNRFRLYDTKYMNAWVSVMRTLKERTARD